MVKKRKKGDWDWLPVVIALIFIFLLVAKYLGWW
jgi:hypothetical protein